MIKNNRKISIARIFYPVKVLGPGNRVGIWVTGCKKRCVGCISPELQLYDKEREMTISSILELLDKIPYNIDGFTISGGEPFYSPSSIRSLVSELIKINDDVLIYTGYTLDELHEMHNADVLATIKMCSAIIDGPYIRNLNNNIGIMGSSNQTILINKYKDRYSCLESIERHLQTIKYGDSILTIGIPKGDLP